MANAQRRNPTYFYLLPVDLHGWLLLFKLTRCLPSIIGFVRAGAMGATIIGTAFIFAAFLMVLAIGKDYVSFGGTRITSAPFLWDRSCYRRHYCVLGQYRFKLNNQIYDVKVGAPGERVTLSTFQPLCNDFGPGAIEFGR
jgi:hypothetical protein